MAPVPSPIPRYRTRIRPYLRQIRPLFRILRDKMAVLGGSFRSKSWFHPFQRAMSNIGLFAIADSVNEVSYCPPWKAEDAYHLTARSRSHRVVPLIINLIWPHQRTTTLSSSRSFMKAPIRCNYPYSHDLSSPLLSPRPFPPEAVFHFVGAMIPQLRHVARLEHDSPSSLVMVRMVDGYAS